MTEEKPPRWKDPRHIRRSIDYDQKNNMHVNIKLNRNTDADLIEIYESIPNKRAWFKECLLEYAKRNK